MKVMSVLILFFIANEFAHTSSFFSPSGSSYNPSPASAVHGLFRQVEHFLTDMSIGQNTKKKPTDH